ncbi:MAG: LysR family transcriptional regulator [Candidatus Latescibacterota bacterium]
MTQKWFISGARRGVGKTHLAKHICAVLPQSVYAKYGHGNPRRDKSSHFFTRWQELDAFVMECEKSCRHVVVEANRYRAADENCIHIFLKARANVEDLRGDAAALQSQADICLGGTESRADWKEILTAHMDSPVLIDAVLDILADQQRWLSSNALGVRSKIWLVNADGQHIFGGGLADLLVELEHLGSLRAAAKRLRISYSRACRAIDEAEAHFNRQFVRRHADNKEEDDLELTATGKQMLVLYLHVSEETAEFANEAFNDALEEGIAKLEEEA